MRKKAEILRRIRDLEGDINDLDNAGPYEGGMEYHEILGKIKALNWILNKD